MVQCEPPPRKVKPNSLAKDKELTDMVRNMSRRFRLRIEDIQQKADDLEVAAKAVKDRVICCESRMVHLKNYKTVNQIISTENIPKKEKARPSGDVDLVMTDEVLDHYLAHIKELSKTFVPYNTPPVFVRPNISDYVNGIHTNGHATNGVATNGHATNGYSHAPSTDGSHNYLEDEYESDESEEMPAQNGTSHNIPPVPINFPAVIPVHPFRHRGSTPSPLEESSPSPTPTPDVTPIENLVDPKQENAVPQPDLEPNEAQDPIPPPSVPRVQTRPPALASVIDEMKAKVASQPRYVDSDSDPDTEHLSGSQSKPSTSSQQPKLRNNVVQEKMPTAVPRTRQSEATTSQTRVEKPIPPPQPKLPASSSQKKENECKVVDNIFDSDSDTEPLNQPPPRSAQKLAPRNVVAQEALPKTTRQPEPAILKTEKQSKLEQQPPAQPKMQRKAAPGKGNECKVVDNIFDSDSEPETSKQVSASASKGPQSSKPAATSATEEEKPKKIYFLNLPPKEERGPWKIPPKVAAAKTAAVKEASTKETPDEKAIESKKDIKSSKKEPAPKVGKSIFSSDSDSDDEFLKSFSKKKPTITPAAAPKAPAPSKSAPKETPIAKSEPKVVKKPDDNPVPKVIDAPPAAPVSATTLPSVSATTTVASKVETRVETKPEPKAEAKKPKSLFDDSDSDSDLFSASNKPKPLSTTRESTPVTAPPKMDPPPTSEQTEPEPTTSSTKKEATSETMSAKISLIADLQKTFRLPGAPPPSIPVKKSDNEETPREEEETATTTILKSRVRGPPNRRPPTRPNVSN